MAKVIDLVTRRDLCTGCGLCCYSCSSHALEMHWNDYGFLEPVLTGSCKSCGDCITVCPFNPQPAPEIRDENKIAGLFLQEATLHHPRIGRYNGLYAGYSDKFRMTSSSGGVATYVLTTLLEKGIVQHLFLVRESALKGVHYEYRLCSTAAEVAQGAKTKYYPVTLANLLSGIRELQGKVAVTGVGCFIKAIRLAQYKDSVLYDKIAFLAGIICGGIKSSFFTEYLSEKTGVSHLLCTKPEYRIKNPESTASDYIFGCYKGEEGEMQSVRMKSLGDMWGTGFFKNNACDYCDDVTTELADISLGDAWQKPYVMDGRGTSLVVTRSALAEKIIMDGILNGELYMEKLPLDNFLDSQQGSFNHRQKALGYRIKLASGKGRELPPKRDVDETIPFDFKIVQRCRRVIRRKSLEIWRKSRNSSTLDKKLRPYLSILWRVTLLYHYKRDFTNKIKRR
ncbi:MAG: Coenzyme F420 hydrogenase/dehydrogenase, beta subunit C-terminal domain [Bacteroidales bacterium]|nr:Coenzyme F420 hydrogenase/dehydrogenase, beta subunit C-terminal domain [Bacteroidales bacterium]MDD3989172.1 Coenzyme F420 hydrogenase/dehydrogenase, beta subunit C-terminal domain [Bacteroidales bacterium]